MLMCGSHGTLRAKLLQELLRTALQDFAASAGSSNINYLY